MECKKMAACLGDHERWAKALMDALPTAELSFDVNPFLSQLRDEKVLGPYEYAEVTKPGITRIDQVRMVFRTVARKDTEYIKKFVEIIDVPGKAHWAELIREQLEPAPMDQLDQPLPEVHVGAVGQPQQVHASLQHNRPHRWEQRRDLFGKTLYVDHHTTSCKLPQPLPQGLKYMQFTDVSVHLVDHNTMYFSASELPFTQMPAQVQDNQEGAVPNRRGGDRLTGFTQDDCLHLYQKAITSNPTINLHIGKAMTIGPPRVGKTYLRYLLLGMPPPNKCFSTSVMKTAETVHITLLAGHPNEEVHHESSNEEDQESSDEEDLAQRCGNRGCITTDFFGLTSEDNKWVLVNEGSAVQSLLTSLAAVHTPLRSSQEGTTSAQQVTEVISVPSRPTSDSSTPQELFNLLQHPDLRDVKFPDAKILQFLDCGGQLAYHDILPVFTTNPSIYLHVFNLTKDLMECPTDQIFIEGDEQESYSQALSPVSTAQMITRSVIAISSLKNMKGKLPQEVLQSEPSEPSVMLVGTHLDKLEEKYGAGPDTLKKTKEIDSTLQEALKSECLEEMVVKNGKHSLPAMFFPVNNRLFAEENGGQGSELSRHAMKCLKRKISRQTHVQVKVPVKWYLHQLVEMSKSGKERRPVHRYKELYQSCQKQLVVTDVGEFHTMVTYFSALGLLVHLCGEDVEHTEESTCFVFTSPSYLFENISKLYQVQFLDEDRCQGGLLSLKRRGILTEKSLQDLRVDDAHLKHRDFMGVLVQLFIGAEVGERSKDKRKELFIPSVLMLPARGHLNACHSNPQETLPHFSLTFEGMSFVPCGVFTGAIAHLLSVKEWNVSKKSISRIHIPFAVGACDIVHLFDCATHIRVELTVGDQQNTQKYRDIILDAFAESYCFIFHCKTGKDCETSSCKECHSNPFLVLGLPCPTCKPEANHIAVLRVEDGDPQTVRCQEAFASLSDGQKLLFQNMEHYAVIPDQHTLSGAGVMALAHSGEEGGSMAQVYKPPHVLSLHSTAPPVLPIGTASTGSAALPQQVQGTITTAPETAVASVSVLKRPPAHEDTPTCKMRVVTDETAPEGGATAVVSLSTTEGQVTGVQNITHPADVIEALEHQVDTRWRHFGTFLRFEPSLMDIIDSNNNKSVTDCMLDLVTKWVEHYEGTGGLPRTWQTVLKAVKNSGCGLLADELAMKYGVTLT